MNMINLEKYYEIIDNVIINLRKFDKHNRVSNILLFRDFLNKLNKLTIMLGYESNLSNYKADIRKFSNLFNYFSSDWIKEIKTQEEFNIDLLERGFKVKGGRYKDDLFIYLYVYWELCKDLKEIKSLCNYNPYLPVIKIIERCEVIFTHSGNLEIDNFTFNNLEKYHSFQLPSLDYDFLDYIDETCMKYGRGEVPNQEKTNQLWEEFKKMKQNG